MLFADSMDDHFGTYSKSMFTLLQILTGDSWSSVIARTAMKDEATIGAFYFVSYVVVVAIITMNVVQAVFIDSYLTAHDEAETKTQRRRGRRNHQRERS